MDLFETLEEIELTKGRILLSQPGTVEHGNFIVALVILQDTAIQQAMVRMA